MLARLFAASLDLLDSAGERAEGGEDPSLAGQGGKSLRQRQLHQNVEDAMESEDYDTARTLQKELNFMSLPSQTGMRASEHQQRVEMHRNMAGAVLKNPDLFSSARGFATDALSSWRTISGAELKFVATPNKATPARGSPSEGTARAHQDGMPSTRLFAGDADKVGNTPGRGSSAGEEPSAAEKDEFQENIELMHLSLGMDPPDLHAAAMCALRMVEIVGDEETDDGEDLRLELASACYDKIEAALSDTLSAEPPRASLGVDTVVGAVRLGEAAEAFDLLGIAGECAGRAAGAEVGKEAATRTARVTAAIRLAESMQENAGGRKGGSVKSDDALFVSAIQSILAAAGATLGRAEAAGASGAMAAAVARGVGIAGGEGCAGIFKLLIAERNIAEQAEQARASVASWLGDAGGEVADAASADVLKTDMLLEETSQVLKMWGRFEALVQQRLERAGEGGHAPLSPALDSEAHVLAGHYVALEEAYLRGCVAKARANNAINEETNTATMVEDVFFLVQKCCLRAFATRQLMAALPLGNIAGEVLRVTLQEPLEASSQLLREQSVGVATKSVAGLFKLQLNNLHFAAACAKRLLGLVSHSFAASFPQAGGAMGALTLELEDIHKSFSGLLHESVVLLCTCTSPDIVGHVERLLSKASLDASSADMVLPEAVSSPAPKSGGLFASFVKGRTSNSDGGGGGDDAGGAGAPGSPAKTRSSGQGGDALVARVRRAVQEILSSLRETSPPAVFRLILEETLKGVAAAMEKGVLGRPCSVTGALFLQRQLRGITQLFSSPPDADGADKAAGEEEEEEEEEGWGVSEGRCRVLLGRVRDIVMLLAMDTVSDAADYIKEHPGFALALPEAQAVLKQRHDLPVAKIDALVIP